MTKTNIPSWDVVAANNTDVNSNNVSGSGLVSTADNSFREIMSQVAKLYADFGGNNTTGGTANAITITTAETLTALATGLMVGFKAGAANTTAATVTVDSLASKAIRRQGDTALSANDILSGGRYLLVYDSAYNSAAGAWILVNPSVSVTASTSFADNTFFITDDGDATKKIAFQASGIATGTTRTITMPDSDVTLQPVATSAQYLANTAGKAVSTDQVWAAVATPTVLTPGVTVAWDLSTGIDFTLAPAQNFTLSNPTNVKVGQKGSIRIVQDVTGSRTFTKSSNMKTAGGVAIVLSTAANAVDVLYYHQSGASETLLSLTKGWA